jgi:succinate dehydrogenase/fumarate reductase flavoprotein subunit
MPSKSDILKKAEYFSCDVMVIGAGGAGLRAAISAATSRGRTVFIVSKSKIGHACNTYISKAVVAASGQTESSDNARAHWVDTLEGGRLINDPAIVARMTQRIPAEIAFLTGCGVRLSMQGKEPRVFKVPGHQHPRHVSGANWKGSDLILPLVHRARQLGVRFFEHVFVTRLFAADSRIRAAVGISTDGRFVVFKARSVILATGGYGQIFRNTNNAPGTTGDGQALSYALGVPLKDMEFVQFYPTALGRRGSRLFLNEKLLAQAGVTLENGSGEDIFKRHGYPDPLAVTRDMLAQLVFREIREAKADQKHAVINLNGLSSEAAAELSQLLPSSFRRGQKRFPVVPTAHYCMGGIVTDDHCRTSIEGLFAVGEAAGGCHGANRLGGNSLAEIFSMGSLAGETAAREAPQQIHLDSIRRDAADEKKRLEGMFSEKGNPPRQLIDDLKKIMWDKVGIIREKKALEAALDMLQGTWPPASVTVCSDLVKHLEFQNMRLVSEMVCRAALMRTESRGSHFRQDFAKEDNESWKNNIEVRKGVASMALNIAAVPLWE